jgi:lipopolysaccharide/colanic/teichoic acid biosynthesis glycosyltransferase
MSRKKNHKVYVKEHDSLYCGLLKLACVSDQPPISNTLTPLIDLTSIGPVLFKQHRYGLDGDKIKILKFCFVTATIEKMQMRIKFDLEYIRHWSLWMDFKIVMFTFSKGLRYKC